MLKLSMPDIPVFERKCFLFLLLIYTVAIPQAWAQQTANYPAPDVDEVTIQEDKLGPELVDSRARPKIVDEQGYLQPPVINAIVLGSCTECPRDDNGQDCCKNLSAGRGLSVHFIIATDGHVTRVVDPKWLAPYAGLSVWGSHYVYNDKACSPGECRSKPSLSLDDRSISLCFANEGQGKNAYSATQVKAAAELIRFLQQHYPIKYILGREEVHFMTNKKYRGHIIYDDQKPDDLLPWPELQQEGIDVLPPSVASALDDNTALLAYENPEDRDKTVEVACLKSQLEYFGYKVFDIKYDLGIGICSVMKVFNKRYNRGEYLRWLKEAKTQSSEEVYIPWTLLSQRMLEVLLKRMAQPPPEEIMTCSHKLKFGNAALAYSSTSVYRYAGPTSESEQCEVRPPW